MRISYEATVTRLIVGIGLVVWAWNVMQPVALVDWDVRALRVHAECVEYPFSRGVLSGLQIGRASCATEPSQKDGVPRMVLEHVVMHSLSVYRFGQCVGFLLLCGVVWMAKRLVGRLKPKCAVALLPVLLISGCAGSPLPKSAFMDRGDIPLNEYDQQMAGYSALRSYGEPVGYYVAKVTAYSDVAHLPPSYGHIYGPLNVRRPLLYDDRIEVYQRDAFPADSWWRQGTVILGASRDSKKSQDVKVESKTEKQKDKDSSIMKDRPLSERLKPVRETGKSKGTKEKTSVREELVAYSVLDSAQSEGNAVVLADFLRTHATSGGLVLRLVGHETNEDLMGRLMAAARETGLVDDVQMYNLKGVLMVGEREIPHGIEVMLVRRTATPGTQGD